MPLEPPDVPGRSFALVPCPRRPSRIGSWVPNTMPTGHGKGSSGLQAPRAFCSSVAWFLLVLGPSWAVVAAGPGLEPGISSLTARCLTNLAIQLSAPGLSLQLGHLFGPCASFPSVLVPFALPESWFLGSSTNGIFDSGNTAIIRFRGSGGSMVSKCPQDDSNVRLSLFRRALVPTQLQGQVQGFFPLCHPSFRMSPSVLYTFIGFRLRVFPSCPPCSRADYGLLPATRRRLSCVTSIFVLADQWRRLDSNQRP